MTEERPIKCSTCNYHKISHSNGGCDPKIWCSHPKCEFLLICNINPQDFINDVVPDWCPRIGDENV